MVSPKKRTSSFFARFSILNYFGRVQNCLKLKKPKKNSLLRWKNAKVIVVNDKGTRMVKDGEDSHGLQMTGLKYLV